MSAKSYFSDQECRSVGFSEPMIATLKQLADFVDTVNRVSEAETAQAATDAAVGALQEADEDAAISLASLDARIDVFEDFSATDPRYVKKAGDSMSGALDVQALLQCDSFRIDAAPTVAAAIASTHKLAISCNGVTYYLMLSNV